MKRHWPPPFKKQIERAFDAAMRGAEAEAGSAARNIAIGSLIVLLTRFLLENSDHGRS